MNTATLYAPIDADIRAVDAVVRTRLHSEVVLVRQVAEYIISAGGKRNRALATLHKEHGFADVGAFIKALKAAASASGGKVSAGGKKRRKRAVITAETKAAVKALAQDGKTSAEIARTAGISVPSVQNIKKELGLTKARKK